MLLLYVFARGCICAHVGVCVSLRLSACVCMFVCVMPVLPVCALHDLNYVKEHPRILKFSKPQFITFSISQSFKISILSISLHPSLSTFQFLNFSSSQLLNFSISQSLIASVSHRCSMSVIQHAQARINQGGWGVHVMITHVGHCSTCSTYFYEDMYERFKRTEEANVKRARKLCKSNAADTVDASNTRDANATVIVIIVMPWAASMSLVATRISTPLQCALVYTGRNQCFGTIAHKGMSTTSLPMN